MEGSSFKCLVQVRERDEDSIHSPSSVGEVMNTTRTWAMPNHDTFSVKPIGEFVIKYIKDAVDSVDPFARNNEFASVRNDLNPFTGATHHMDALAFLELLKETNKTFDVGLFDPPYSPRQLAECYQQIGRKTTMQDTQSKSWSDWKNALAPLIRPSGFVLSFGWNTVGMGKKRGFEIVEILLVCHGGMHNDTICVAERRIETVV